MIPLPKEIIFFKDVNLIYHFKKVFCELILFLKPASPQLGW